jgi:large subunit ribosomal protein L1
MRLPYPVDTSLRICVICPPDSPAAKSAMAAGASLVGEETIFEAVKEGRIEFDRCICHTDSQQKLAKANLGRILGPKGLMPSPKTGTVVRDIASAVKGMMGGSEYRERQGVVRLAIGQLGFSPEEMQQNVKAFMSSLKKDLALLSEKVAKDIHEVVRYDRLPLLSIRLQQQVLSSTNSPGFPLSGDFRSEASLPTKDLSVL